MRVRVYAIAAVVVVFLYCLGLAYVILGGPR